MKMDRRPREKKIFKREGVVNGPVVLRGCVR